MFNSKAFDSNEKARDYVENWIGIWGKLLNNVSEYAPNCWQVIGSFHEYDNSICKTVIKVEELTIE